MPLIGKNRENISQIPDTREQEKEHGYPFRALATVVEKQLWDARAEIEYSAEVPEDLAPEGEFHNIVGGRVFWVF